MELPQINESLGHALFKATADHSLNAITITEAAEDGSAGPIIYVNPAFTEMTGYTADEVVGKTPGMLQGPKTEAAVLQRLGDQIRRGEVFHGETVNYRKDGREFILEWKVVPVQQNGRVTHHVAVQYDVTGEI